MFKDKSQYEWLVGIIDNLNLDTAVIHHSQTQTQNFQLPTTEAEKWKESKSCHMVLLCYPWNEKNRKEIQTVSKSFIFVNQDKADQRTVSHMTAIPPDHDSL